MVMIQRTVVIYRDDKGFGLRVSGENPVFVESVKSDGAAWKAGIRSGDRIIKVNGTTVNNHSHQEVVHMIQYCGNHVALTLRGSTNQLSTNQLLTNNQSTLINDQQNLLPVNNIPLNLASSTSTRIRPYNNSIINNNFKDHNSKHITPPLPANDSTLIEFEKSRLETIKKMLGDEREFLNKLRKEEKYPNEKETEINSTMNRIKRLEEQLSSVNETNRQTVARYIIPLDASFSQLNLKLNTSTHSSSRTSSNSSINQHHHHQNFNLINNNNISRRHLSAENLHFFTQLPNNNEQATESTTKKSHSFGQYDHQTSQTLQNLQNQSINNSIDSQLNSTFNSSTASKDTNISFYSSSSYSNLQNSNKNLSTLSQDEQEFDISYLLNNNYKSNIDLLLERKNVNLLFNFLHYLLINKQDINPLLFYILTDVFKKVCENPKFSCLDNSTSLQHHIRKWAFEIYSTFLFNDSPLRLNCDYVMKEDQTQFYELLNENFTSATTLVNTIFDPYLDKSKEIINQQIEQFKKNLNSNLLNGSNGNQLIIKKIQPSIIVECLTNELTDLPAQVSINASNSSTLLTQITILISYLLNSTLNSNSSIQSIAQLTCFTSILYHCFPHFLVSSDENANTLAKLIPVPVYLSFHQTNTSNHSNQLQHKRHKSLPASSNNPQSTTITNINSSSAIPYHLSSLSQPTGNHNPQPVSNSSCSSNQPKTLAQQANNNQIFLNSGHVFSLLNTTKPNNCTNCQQSIWAMFGWHCQLCLLTAHHWCLRSTADCPGPIDNVLDNQNNNDLNQNNINNLQHLSSTILSSSSRSKSKSNIRSTGGRLLENILKNRAESLKHKKDEVNNKCVRKKSDPSISSSSNLFQNDFSTGSSRNKYLNSPSSSSDSELEDNQFLNQADHSFSIFNDNMFNRDDQILIDNDSRQLSPNYLSNLPLRSNSSVQLSTEMKKACKRQDIFKELISTERTHVKNLKILNDIFYVPIFQEQLLAPEHIDYIFSNHYKLHEIHTQIYSLLKQKKKEQQKCIQDQLQYPQQHNNLTNQFVILDQGIGQLLVHIFEGDIGKRLEEAASEFCSKQTIGGDILRNKLKKDSKLSSFLQEAEANKCCRRLGLKDMLASCFQRITKYPLLMENLMKETPDKESEEYKLIERACKRSKQILYSVNECVKKSENRQKLIEIQRKTEKTSFNEALNKILNNFDLTEKTLLYDGQLTIRIVRKNYDVHLLLCTDVLILLFREGDKFKFKLENKNQSPIVPIKNIMTRPNATDSRSFFIISKPDLMYEFVASSETEKNIWLKQISEAGGMRSAQIKLRDLTSRDEQQFKDEQHEQVLNKLIKEQDLLCDLNSKKENEQDQHDDKSDQQNNENSVTSTSARIDGTISYVRDEDVNLNYNRNYLRSNQPTTDHAYSSTSRSQQIIERIQTIESEIEKLQNEKQGLLRELNEEECEQDRFEDRE